MCKYDQERHYWGYMEWGWGRGKGEGGRTGEITVTISPAAVPPITGTNAAAPDAEAMNVPPGLVGTE